MFSLVKHRMHSSSAHLMTVRHIFALHYALLGTTAAPTDFLVFLIVGFMIDGLQLPVNCLTQFPVTAYTWPHQSL